MRKLHIDKPLAIGLFAAVAVLIVGYFGFVRKIPFSKQFTLHVVVRSANSVRSGSPVRIAGVDVGKVESVKFLAGKRTAQITISVKENGLPIHSDARVSVANRLFLEGNVALDIDPGSPSAPNLKNGATIPVTQTSVPVQLDQLLTALQRGTREDLQALLTNYGAALTAKPTARDDAEHDPSVAGQSAAQAFNDALSSAGPALRDTAIVADALLGREPNDLSRAIRGVGKTAGALADNELQLQDLITNANTTFAALADEHVALNAAVRSLPQTLTQANQTLISIDAALPPTRTFARLVLPGLRDLPATMDSASPWFNQVRLLLRQQELAGLLQDLTPTVGNLAQTVGTGQYALAELNQLSRCVTKVVIPAGNSKLDDGPRSTNSEAYKALLYMFAGFQASAQEMDGNGAYLRLHAGGGDVGIRTGKVAGRPAGSDRLYGNVVEKPLGTKPMFPGKTPPIKLLESCMKQSSPALNSAKTGPADEVR